MTPAQKQAEKKKAEAKAKADAAEEALAKEAAKNLADLEVSRKKLEKDAIVATVTQGIEGDNKVLIGVAAAIIIGAFLVMGKKRKK